MILVADSGSTKTAWALASSDATRLVTEGLNPHFTSDEVCQQVFARVRAEFGTVDVLWFYGAGCGNAEQAMRLQRLAADSGLAAEVHVCTDMLGACRAAAGHAEGYVAILGTGSNCCYYDGNNVVRSATSTGYVLGDHGSANHVGRMLLQDYLSGVMPTEVAEAFGAAYPFDPSQWISRVYHMPNANRFLASLAPFATTHEDFSYCRDVVRHSLEKWFFYQLAPLRAQADQVAVSHPCQSPTLHVVGSFGRAVANSLHQVLSAHGVVVGSIVADPLPSLVAYHYSQGAPVAL